MFLYRGAQILEKGSDNGEQRPVFNHQESSKMVLVGSWVAGQEQWRPMPGLGRLVGSESGFPLRGAA